MPGQQKLNAVFYRSRNGVEPVRDWLKGLPKADRKAIGEDIAYVQYKWPIGKPRIDHLRGPVWEVRTRLDNRIGRTLFAVAHGQMVAAARLHQEDAAYPRRGNRPRHQTI